MAKAPSDAPAPAGIDPGKQYEVRLTTEGYKKLGVRARDRIVLDGKTVTDLGADVTEYKETGSPV